MKQKLEPELHLHQKENIKCKEQKHLQAVCDQYSWRPLGMVLALAVRSLQRNSQFDSQSAAASFWDLFPACPLQLCSTAHWWSGTAHRTGGKKRIFHFPSDSPQKVLKSKMQHQQGKHSSADGMHFLFKPNRILIFINQNKHSSITVKYSHDSTRSSQY